MNFAIFIAIRGKKQGIGCVCWGGEGGGGFTSSLFTIPVHQPFQDMLKRILTYMRSTMTEARLIR